ncbi:MAG: patatin-like phospholipase family protein [Gammaproteobacteria bacterium]|nr:patatin-like phospholipase family protein [Gammaproteobacteria bacterium]
MILRLFKLISLISVLIYLSGCTSYGVIDNSPIDHKKPKGYSWYEWTQGKHNDDLNLTLSFSGGGTRAAALSYGVLQGLRDTKIPVNGKQTRLLDQIDHISSVSGGSFTAAYYGLHGEGIFDDFKDAFLLRDVENYLLWNLFNPLEWFRRGGRTEMAIEYYNETVFHNATFSDLNKDGPLIVINASTLGTGVRFSFLQEYFDLICSDIDSFPIAKAVAASSAVPIAFLPVVLEKYSDCDSVEPIWLSQARSNEDNGLLVQEVIQGFDKLSKKGNNRYIHLVDGGITDNLGLHAVLDMATMQGGVQKLLKKTEKKPPRHFVILSVNSSTEPESHINLSNEAPSLGDTIDSMSSVQLHRYNSTTLEFMGQYMKQWAKQVSTPEHPVKTYFIRINLNNFREPRRKLFFNKIPTSFTLSKEVIESLITAGNELLQSNPEYQRLLSDLRADKANKIN